MIGKRYSTEQKVRILRDVDAGKSIVEVCREKNISDVNITADCALAAVFCRAIRRTTPSSDRGWKHVGLVA